MMQQISKFQERFYSICIKAASGESVLSSVRDPGFRDREDIIFGVERIPALAANLPDLQDWKTATIKRMVGMEDCCCSQIPAVVKCILM